MARTRLRPVAVMLATVTTRSAAGRDASCLGSCAAPVGTTWDAGSVLGMRVDILSKEYPPEIYGGAGVHVAELVRALRGLSGLDVRVQAFGGPRDEAAVSSYADLPELADANAAMQTLGVDLTIADGCQGADLVHSPPWYANLGGHLAGLLYDVT